MRLVQDASRRGGDDGDRPWTRTVTERQPGRRERGPEDVRPGGRRSDVCMSAGSHGPGGLGGYAGLAGGVRLPAGVGAWAVVRWKQQQQQQRYLCPRRYRRSGRSEPGWHRPQLVNVTEITAPVLAALRCRKHLGRGSSVAYVLLQSSSYARRPGRTSEDVTRTNVAIAAASAPATPPLRCRGATHRAGSAAPSGGSRRSCAAPSGGGGGPDDTA
ncbi:unnamed protein product [Lampetra fluviatilis]